MSPYCIPGIKHHLDHTLTMIEIETVVCNFLAVDPNYLHRKARNGNIPTARFLVYYLSKNFITPAPALTHLSNYYGQHHTMAITGIKVINDRISYEPGFKELVQRIETKIKML